MEKKRGSNTSMAELDRMIVEHLQSKEPMIYPENVRQIREEIERIAFGDDEELEVLLEK